MHEALPGHAWQGAYLSERHDQIHTISSLMGFNAFIEGFSTPPGRAATPLMREASRLTARAAGITPTTD